MRVFLAGVTAALVGAAGIVPFAYAGERPISFTNSPTEAAGDTPSGVTVAITKTMLNGSRVGSARVSPTDPQAPADEYLIPANAKADAGIVDRYEDFKVDVNGWADVAELTFTFSRPVRDPRLHVFGTGGVTEGPEGRRDDYWPGVDLVRGTPTMPTFTNAAGFPGFTVTDTSIVPDRVYRVASTTCGVVYTCGTVQVNGTITSFTIRLRARNVRTMGDAGVPHLWGAFKLSLYEDDSDAPASYGAASHAITDTFIGEDVTADNINTLSFMPRGLRQNTDTDDGLKPEDIQRLPDGATSYSLEVPVRSGSGADLAGWIDFDRDGRFEASERTDANVDAGAGKHTLTWNVPEAVGQGSTWMRLRIAATSGGVADSTGWADSGEVEDYQLALPRREAITPTTESSEAEPPVIAPPVVNPPRVVSARVVPSKANRPRREQPRTDRPRYEGRHRFEGRPGYEGRPRAERRRHEAHRHEGQRPGSGRPHADWPTPNRAAFERMRHDRAEARRARSEADARRHRGDTGARDDRRGSRRDRASALAAARRERAEATRARIRDMRERAADEAAKAEVTPEQSMPQPSWESTELKPLTAVEYGWHVATGERPDF
ncbi:GEVED domain-containing protein [Nonomuraea sp. bgisy101]|uniref:GEVED domain-containing protein n=1 Tax=Nonomuraea sp. bgisy101 TaxID=3413784 RepID=UPI003D718305